MKVTRKQLRRLIETTIKPFIPNVSADALGKIDALDDPKQVNNFAGAFGYPEDRSYSDDLRTYDAANRVTFDSVAVQSSSYELIQVPIPYELVDNLIEAHLSLPSEPDAFRSTGIQVFQHIENYLADKYGNQRYDVHSYGAQGASGYRAGEYEKAMMKVGEYI
jgi:hypothetical protein